MILRSWTFVLSVLCWSWTPPIFSSWLSCPKPSQQAPYPDDVTLPSEFPVKVTEQVKRIAIIGAGSSGIAALKTFLYDIPKPDGQRWEIEVFEQRDGLGGIWLRDDDSAQYPYLPESPVYPQLRTNTPVPTMTYPGFPFPPNTSLFPSWDQVQAYHETYATHFNLHPYIRLNHSVESAYWVGNSSAGLWELSISTNGHPKEIIPLDRTPDHDYSDSRRPLAGRISRHFDHLVVGSGHYHYPKFPSWAIDDDAKEWLRRGKSRRIMHSVYFRETEVCAGKVVLVVGAGVSGRDIAAQCSEVANKVYLSFNRPPPWDIPGTIYKAGTKAFTPSSIRFSDGTEVSDVDVVILATGYHYQFPFLDPSDPYNQHTKETVLHERHAVMTTVPYVHSRSESEQRLTTNLKYLFPLDRHIVSLSPLHPLNALFFIGLHSIAAYAPVDTAQSIFAGNLIASPDRVYPTSHITGHTEGWDQTLAREILLKNLTTFETRMAEEGFDLYNLGHRLNVGSCTEGEYQDSLITHLQSQGLVPRNDDRGYIFVEPWRTRMSTKPFVLRRIWQEVEDLGEEEVERWLSGVETEEEWADLMDRLLEWDSMREGR